MAADAMSVQASSVSIKSSIDSSLLACKYDMDTSVHESLREHIFSAKGMGDIIGLLNDPSTLFYGGIAQDKTLVSTPKPHIHAGNIDTTNVRFATLHVRCTGDQANPLSVNAIQTLPAYGFMCIISQLPNELYRNLIDKLTYDLSLTGEYNVPNKSFIFSFDVYWNRRRESSGGYHRDVDVSVETQTRMFSIEIFSPPDIVVLGTEVFEADFKELPHNDTGGVTEAALTTFIQRRVPGDVRTRSHRFLVTDGTVVLVNNNRTVHATPICDDTRATGICSGLFLDPHRYENRGEPEARAIVESTKRNPRSFIRCWISDSDPTMLFSYLTRGHTVLSLDHLGPFIIPEILDRPADTREHSYGGNLKGGGQIKLDLKIMNNDKNVNLVINNINELIKVDPSEISSIQKKEEQYMLKQMGGKTRKHKKLHKKSRNKK
jgi:hypothetical protein